MTDENIAKADTGIQTSEQQGLAATSFIQERWTKTLWCVYAYTNKMR